MPLAFDLKIEGNPVTIMEGKSEVLRLGINAAVTQTTEEVVRKGREMIASRLGGGGRAANLYTRDYYTNDRGPDAPLQLRVGLAHSRWFRNPRGGKLTRAGSGRTGLRNNDILMLHATGGTILPQRGDYLLVPAGKSRISRTRIGGDTFYRRASRIGDFGKPPFGLRPLRSGRGYAVLYKKGARGRPRKRRPGEPAPSRRAALAGAVVIAYLLKSVTLRQRLDFAPIEAFRDRRLPEALLLQLSARGWSES